jgi:hypothetical protein
MKAGDLVAIRGDDPNELYVVLKGPYELITRLPFDITELHVAYDLYSSAGMKSGVKKDDIVIVKRC